MLQSLNSCSASHAVWRDADIYAIHGAEPCDLPSIAWDEESSVIVCMGEWMFAHRYDHAESSPDSEL